MNASTATDSDSARQDAEEFRETYEKIRAQVARMIVGQRPVIEGVLTALLAGGHVLLEGVPGLGKTMLVHSLGEAINLQFSRIQFTPDMMPADIQGTQVLMDQEGGGQEVRFRQGPLVANLVLADEINRATPKTQSALLEAMQERQITVGGKTIALAEPFCVMATQNPVEQEGTYPLPEAQLDRFLLKLVVGYPNEDEYHEILNRTTGTNGVELSAVSTGEEILRMREIVRSVPVPEHVQSYAVRLVMGTQPNGPHSCDLINEAVALGASPRGAQSLLLCGKVQALLAGRFAVSDDDIRGVALPVLRHRVLVNFQGQSQGVTPDDVVKATVGHVKPTHGAA